MISSIVIVLGVIAPVISGVLFSPYKDVLIGFHWQTNVMGTVIDPQQALLQVLQNTDVDIVTLGFATGDCGIEQWSGLSANIVANNVGSWVSGGKKYIISTGGSDGGFKCASDEKFRDFINRYNSDSLVGIDFDIETTWLTQADIESLVERVKNAQAHFPKLRWSFTVPTLGGDSSPNIGDRGQYVLKAINKYGLTNYYINLMAMDYGSISQWTCVVSNGQCDMGQSAVRAAQTLHTQFGVPYSQIELTPMIGGNDFNKTIAPQQFFEINDVEKVTSFAVENGLAGVHFWSFDRDNDCPEGVASATCNTYGKGGTLGFTKAFTASLKSKLSTSSGASTSNLPTPIEDL